MSDSDFLRPDGSIDLEALNRSVTLASRMGIVIVEVTDDRVVATMPVEGNTQPQGLLHGGASVVLAETLGSVGAHFAAPPGTFAVGVDINATHHRAVRDGEVVGVATPVHRGSTVSSWDVVISQPTGARVCTARLTCLYIQATRPA